ncbi:hypothetical protein Back11_20720 [Paenibacillus baekrokdamisoli]|uniref:Uncharacterized protein n=1 Tax=Paenibacillus baekrokdamisoli TaxID=1712516 RepID=A0A3G9IPD6_9BACL|nr:cytochrome c [Paenibacillus baekrokdamisoli]MBB3069919.1 cytochrome c551 [Paenibacillus baekrokdamisoli]BBH20727.1 hypothetical protein Back11_20720 [Paenibacillus baekrokdamisoli]
MTRKRLSMLLIAAAFIALAATGCGNKTNTNTNVPAPAPAPSTGTGTTNNTGNTTTTTTTATAESVYKAQCVGCHAANLSGGVGPNLQKVGGKLTTAQITTQIQNGGGGMPAFKGTLTADEITNLTNWLASKK